MGKWDSTQAAQPHTLEQKKPSKRVSGMLLALEASWNYLAWKRPLRPFIPPIPQHCQAQH